MTIKELIAELDKFAGVSTLGGNTPVILEAAPNSFRELKVRKEGPYSSAAAVGYVIIC